MLACQLSLSLYLIRDKNFMLDLKLESEMRLIERRKIRKVTQNLVFIFFILLTLIVSSHLDFN